MKGFANAAIFVAALLTACASPWPDESAALDEQQSATGMQVKGALIAEFGMGGTAIAVEDHEEGRITLSGFVDSDEARARAAEVAAAQEGVFEVINEIEVR